MKKNEKRLICDIDEMLHRKIKTKAVKTGISIKDAIIKAMSAWLNEKIDKND